MNQPGRQARIIMETNSRKTSVRLSVKPERAESFLERLANLPMSPSEKRLKMFIDRFDDLMPTHGPKSFWGPGLSQLVAGAKPRPAAKMFLKAKDEIMDAWKLSDEIERQGKLLVLAGLYMSGSEISGMDGFLHVLLHAIRKAHLLAYCRNRECKEPYFFAQRVGQPYCSHECAKPAQREAKLRWWNEVGKSRRPGAKEKGKRGQ